MHSPIGQLAHEQACSADDLQWSTQATSSVLRLLSASGVRKTVRWLHEELAGGTAGTASARQLLVALCMNALLHDTTHARTPRYRVTSTQAPWTTASCHAPAHHKALCCECHRACHKHDAVQSASCVTYCMDVTMRLRSLRSGVDQLTGCTRLVPLTVLAFSQYIFHCCTCVLTASAACAGSPMATHQRSNACRSATASCGGPSMRLLSATEVLQHNRLGVRRSL